MSKVKSFSVGNGDMFYIKHNSDNFTIIDCFLSEDNGKEIIDEIIAESKNKSISRFISTHPDEDHIKGLVYFDERKEVVNFYCVKNEATKNDESDDFIKYCGLRDSNKAFYLHKGCTRKWMNESNTERDSSGLFCLWPNTHNQYYKEALTQAKNGGSPNNISPIIRYGCSDSSFLWMGDLETEFMKNIESDLTFLKVNILFAPHHGRDSGKIPKSILDKLKPDIIIIGEAPSDNLNYYQGYNTITQNSAGDITFVNDSDGIHIYVSNKNYSVNFLINSRKSNDGGYYIGTLAIK